MILGSNLHQRTYDELLVTAATWLLAGGLLWLTVLLLAVLVEALSHGRWRPARFTLAPLALRQALLAAIVAALTACGLGSAHADAPAGPGGGTRQIEGLQLPSRPEGDLATQAAEHVVRQGESLWLIARDLRPLAAAPELADLVRRLHHLNRGVIGPDPDVLQPGQRLSVPAPTHDTGGTR